MTEEAKEILENIKETIENNNIEDITTIGYDTYPERWLKLLNYITNLQKENEKLKNELKSKPDNEITLETKDGQIMTIIQSERIDMQEKLNKSLNNAIEKYQDYKQRNEKAIELIRKALVERDITGNGTLDLSDLLNILQGGNE